MVSKEKSLQQLPHSQLTATLEVLDTHGVSQDDFKNLRTDPTVAEEVSLLLKGRPVPLKEELFHGNPARWCSRQNFFGFASYYNFFGIKAWERFTPPPMNEEMVGFLDSKTFYTSGPVCKSHFIFLMPRISPALEDEVETARGMISITDLRTTWVNLFPFCTGFKWYVMTHTDLPLMGNKTFKKQREMLPDLYDVPTLLEETMKRIFSNLLDRPRCYAPTRTSTTRNSDRYVIGCYEDDSQLKITTESDAAKFENVRISGKRTF